jgi:hypothetical protein
MAHDRWATLGRVDLVSFGKDLVTDRLERLGCTVVRPTNPVDGKLEVGTATGRSVEVFVATQRVGGYAFWTKRRLHPARHRLAVLVLLNQGPEPALYVVPSEDWLEPAPPLTDRDYEVEPASLSTASRSAGHHSRGFGVTRGRTRRQRSTSARSRPRLVAGSEGGSPRPRDAW